MITKQCSTLLAQSTFPIFSHISPLHHIFLTVLHSSLESYSFGAPGSHYFPSWDIHIRLLKGKWAIFFHSVQITSSRWYLLDNTPFPSNLKLMSFIAGCPQNFHSFTYSHIHSFSKIYESSLTYCNYAREGPGIQWWANIDGPCFHAAKNLEKGYSREGTL